MHTTQRKLKRSTHAQFTLNTIASSLFAGATIYSSSALAASCAAPWTDGATYISGQVSSYQHANYKAISAHTAYLGANWNPVIAASLWRKVEDCTGSSVTSTQTPITASCAAIWREGQNFAVNEIVSYQGNNYKALVAHTSYIGANWNPVNTPSLWSLMQNCRSDTNGSTSTGNSGANGTFANSIPDPTGLGFGQNSEVKFINRLLDSGLTGHTYQYAPAIVYENNTFHMFTCAAPIKDDSLPVDAANRIDDIVYSSSSDGRIWEQHRAVIQPAGSKNYFNGRSDRSACDPNVIKYNDEYYMFYTNNMDTGEHTGEASYLTVAKSKTIDGKYQTLRTNDAWVSSWTETPNSPEFPPKNIMESKYHVNKQQDKYGVYGVGQSTAVVKDHKIHLWYTDSTSTFAVPDETHALQKNHIYYTTSTDPTSWNGAASKPIKDYDKWLRRDISKPYDESDFVIEDSSIDIKLAADGSFVMIGTADIDAVGNYHAALFSRTSKDGEWWTKKVYLSDNSCTNGYAEDCSPFMKNNAGMSGDESGHLIGNTALIAYGSSSILEMEASSAASLNANLEKTRNFERFPRADIYGTVVRPTGSTNNIWNGIPWGMKLPSPNKPSDYNEVLLNAFKPGYNVPTCLPEEIGPNKSTGHCIIENGNIVDTPIPADYDGKGKADIAARNEKTGSWYILSSKTNQAIPGIGYPLYSSNTAGTNVQIAVANYTGKNDAIGLLNRELSPPVLNYYDIVNQNWVLWPWEGLQSDHKFTSADYDGDGKADPTIIDGNSAWFIRKTDPNSQTVASWGSKIIEPGTTDTPATMDKNAQIIVGDFFATGNSRARRAFVNPNGTVYIANDDSNPAIVSKYVWPGYDDRRHKLIAASFNGPERINGPKKTNLAIVDLMTGRWYAQDIITHEAVSFRGATLWDIPAFPELTWKSECIGNSCTSDFVPMAVDFDGDKKADLVLFDKKSMRWYVKYSQGFKIY